MTHPPEFIPVHHVDLLPQGIALGVTACIVGVLWYLYKRWKASKPKPQEPK